MYYKPNIAYPNQPYLDPPCCQYITDQLDLPCMNTTTLTMSTPYKLRKVASRKEVAPQASLETSLMKSIHEAIQTKSARSTPKKANPHQSTRTQTGKVKLLTSMSPNPTENSRGSPTQAPSYSNIVSGTPSPPRQSKHGSISPQCPLEASPIDGSNTPGLSQPSTLPQDTSTTSELSVSPPTPSMSDEQMTMP